MNLNHIEVLAAAHQDKTILGTLLTGTPDLVQATLALLFPVRATKRCVSSSEVREMCDTIRQHTSTLLRTVMEERKSTQLAHQFVDSLPSMRDLLLLDAKAMHSGDPAAKSIEEIILCYPGFFAIATYRLAHFLHIREVPLLPRVMTEYAHRETGIDIHPGATIGHSFCIDHGTGIVIGETTIIKNNVQMYQGVTLGGLVVNKTLQNQKRHPTIEDDVVIYANATILGGDTVIGKGSIIGGSVWITTSVPPRTKVYHTPDIIIKNTKVSTTKSAQERKRKKKRKGK